MLREARLLRPIPTDARPQSVQGLSQEEEELLQDLNMARLLRKQYYKESARKYTGIQDARVTVFEISLGTHMAQIAHLRDDGPKPRGLLK